MDPVLGSQGGVVHLGVEEAGFLLAGFCHTVVDGRVPFVLQIVAFLVVMETYVPLEFVWGRNPKVVDPNGEVCCWGLAAGCVLVFVVVEVACLMMG